MATIKALTQQGEIATHARIYFHMGTEPKERRSFEVPIADAARNVAAIQANGDHFDRIEYKRWPTT